MRIGVVTSLFPTPGRPHEGIFAERRWRTMRERGHDVRIVRPTPLAPRLLARGSWADHARAPARERRADLEVVRPRYLHVPRAHRSNAARFAGVALRELDAGPRPDVVVADYAWPAAGIAPGLRARGLPCVINGRGSDVLAVAADPRLAPELAACLQAADGLCAVSEDLLRTMERLAGEGRRGDLVPNGVELETFALRDRAASRAELGLAASGVLVLVVGHLIERKDPLLALEVFARARPGWVAGATCAFFGRGPLAGALERAVRARGLGADVLRRGEVAPAELARWYGAADALLLTSHREGRPNVVLEALASGRPVVATAVGGTPELLGPFRARMLVEGFDPEALAERLRDVVADPPAPDALRSAVAHLSWDACAAALEACLARATGAPAAEGVRT